MKPHWSEDAVWCCRNVPCCMEPCARKSSLSFGDFSQYFSLCIPFSGTDASLSPSVVLPLPMSVKRKSNWVLFWSLPVPGIPPVGRLRVEKDTTIYRTVLDFGVPYTIYVMCLVTKLQGTLQILRSPLSSPWTTKLLLNVPCCSRRRGCRHPVYL